MADTTTIRLNDEVRARLMSRKTDANSSYNDVIEELLNKTGQPITLLDAVESATAEFDDVAAVQVDYISPHTEANMLIIKVHTGEADSLEDTIAAFNPAEFVRISDEDRVVETYQIEAFATLDGPRRQETDESTPVYMSDSVLGTDSLSLETGVSYLRHKLLYPEKFDRPSRRIEEIAEYVRNL